MDVETPQRLRSERFMLASLTAVALGFALWATRPVAVMIVLSIFLAILLQPAVSWLNRFVPKSVAFTVVIVGIGALLVALSGAIVVQTREVAVKTPEYAERFQEMSQGALDLARRAGIEVTWKQVGTADAVTSALGYLTQGVQSLFALGVQTLLILVMVVFMLIEAPIFHDKIEWAFGGERGATVTQSLDVATKKIQRYVVTKTLVSLFTGVLTGLVTNWLGLDFPFIWGAIAFQLNFIPYVGSIVAVFPPALIALVQFDTPTVALVTLLVLGTMQFSIGNIIEPRIMGRSLALSPLVVFTSMFFWGWFWGMMGVVLSVPLTAVARIVCEHVESLEPIAILMGDERAPPASLDPPAAPAEDG